MIVPQPTSSSSPRYPRVTLWRAAQLSIVFVFAIIYWLTLDTGLQPYELHGGDLITHQYAQVQARPGNAPGYPLYTMGGWLWFHGVRGAITAFAGNVNALPPNPMPILSSYSALWALLSLWLLMGIFADISARKARASEAHNPRREWTALLMAWLLTAFFGLTYFFWYYATTTEQYSSAVAQTLAIVLVYLRWERSPYDLRRLFLLAFLCGLSLAHMLTVAFIVLPLVIVVLLRAPWLLRSARAIVGTVLAAALPLTAYAYVWLRGASHPQWWGQGDWVTPQAWFWDFIGTAQGREELLWGFAPGSTFFGNGFPEFMWQELSMPFLVIGAVGIRLLPQRLPAILYGTLALYLAFCWAYRFGNWFQVIIPAYPLLLLGVLPVADTVMQATQRSLPRVASAVRVAIILGLLVAVVWRAGASLPAANSRDRTDDTALHRAADLLAQGPPTGAALFAAVDDALALDYLINIWGVRPDLALVNRFQADHLLASGATVYATWDATPTLVEEITHRAALDSLSPDWIAVKPARTVGVSSSPLHHITESLTLDALATRAAPAPLPPSQSSMATVQQTGVAFLDITLTWGLSTGLWPAELAISVRPTANGDPVIDPTTHQPIQQDRARPVHGLWRDQKPGDSVQVTDSYRLPIPVGSTVDGLLLILYTQGDSGFQNVAEVQVQIAPFP